MVDSLVSTQSIFSTKIQELNVSFQQIKTFQVQLPKFYEKLEGGKPVVFYQIIVKLGSRSWELEKRYNSFSQLDGDLRPKYPQIPKLPGKTLFKVSSLDVLNKRREDLHNYLQDLVNRTDMRTDPHFREFLELDSQIPYSVTYTPEKITELGDLNLGGRDFIYLENQDVIFVAMSDMNITSRIDAYLTNFSFPWEKSGDKTDNYVSVGAVCGFRIQKARDGSLEFLRMWTKSFPSQVISEFQSQRQMLCFGAKKMRLFMQDQIQGKFTHFKFQNNTGTQGFKRQLLNSTIQLGVIQNHNKRVMGLHVDKTLNIIFSIGEDGKFRASDMDTSAILTEITPGKSGLKYLLYSKERNIFIIADGDGFVYFYSVAKAPELLLSLQIPSKSCIRGLCINELSGFLVSGSQDGSLNVFQLGGIGKEKNTKIFNTYQGRPGVIQLFQPIQCRVIAWREKNKELLTSNEDGMITVWSAKEGAPLFVLQAHAGPITQIMWDEEKQQLISCGKDKKIKFWQLPPIWMDEEALSKERMQQESQDKQVVIDKGQQSSGQQKVKEQTVGVVQQKFQTKQDEDDDLTGWDKLKGIESHLTLQKEKYDTKALLNKYKAMSNIDVQGFKKLLNIPASYDYILKFSDLMSQNKQLYEHETFEEDNREDKRMKLNTRIVNYLREAQKIVPFNELLTDITKFAGIATTTYNYNEAFSTKLVVNLQLYYKTLENLGTDLHNDFKKNCENCTDLGCFGLTELAHGSNVRGILTEAHYDHETKEFIIHSPCEESMKFWIGGASKTANMSVIFAQLFVNGKCEGPHAFVVPIRDKQNHMPLPGVTLGDCGKKEGLDAIDNGFMLFNQVRIPKKNLLNRFSDIDEEGKFTSSIKNSDQRFGLQLGALSSGRILQSLASSLGLRYALKIAIQFAAMRTQFGKPKAEQETPLLEYPLHQYRLFPHLANGIGYSFLTELIFTLWGKNTKRLFIPNNPKLAELHAIISVCKAQSTWSSYQGVHQCRQACGGLGYSYYSRFSIILQNMDVNATWEGDNNVLLQQTAKYLLDMFKMKMKKQIKKTVTCEWIKTEPVEGNKCMAENEHEFMNVHNLIEIFQFRANLLLQRTGWELSAKLTEEGADPIDCWNGTQVFYMQDLAKAYGDLLHVVEFSKALERVKEFNEDCQDALGLLFRINALHKIQQDLGTWLEPEYLSSSHVGFIKSGIVRYCEQFKRHSVAFTYLMPPFDEHFDSMLAPADGQLYKSITSRIYNAPNAFGRIPNWKELYEKGE